MAIGQLGNWGCAAAVVFIPNLKYFLEVILSTKPLKDKGMLSTQFFTQKICYLIK
jgi:hypothetical protein